MSSHLIVKIQDGTPHVVNSTLSRADKGCSAQSSEAWFAGTGGLLDADLDAVLVHRLLELLWFASCLVSSPPCPGDWCPPSGSVRHGVERRRCCSRLSWPSGSS
jgi:hypothetical protein